jgi:hypothetical protein
MYDLVVSFSGKERLLVKFRGLSVFIDGSRNSIILRQVIRRFKALFGWILPRDSLLKLSGTTRVLKAETRFAEASD